MAVQGQGDKRARRRAQAAERLVGQARHLAGWYDAATAPDLALTVLPGWTVADLAGHLLVILDGLGSTLDRPSRERPLPNPRYVSGYAPAAGEIDQAARAVAPSGDVAGRLRDAVERLAARLAGDWPEVVAAPRGPVRSDDFVATRILDLVVHGDDLNSAGPSAAVPIDRQALGAATRTAASILAERHPGSSIEVRMPPVSAVQCASPDHPGPSHTRGTPPNVVEMAPLVFLRLATGRTTWAEATAAHEISASGALADLSAMLPLFS